ncbi:hypothetical protein [Aquabacterium sp.]|uniref:hypothetical protein n=1 Tax=Aquabacterium sp. TaxID=1872578 RepID=UPI0025B97B12|nr:hypothetical protein [Aquabacterium sp.]
MVISFTINRTTVELNTGGSLWIDTAHLQVYAAKGPACVTLKEDPGHGSRVREALGWHLISSRKG